MSQSNEKFIKNLSVKLCLLIEDESDPQVDICDEIEALVAKGANVNFHDLNNNNNTPLHFAVLKNDIKIVETLLQCRPDLNQNNNEELTPLKLARQLNLTEVTILLENYQSACDESEHDSNQLFYSTNESYIHSFECGDNLVEKKKKLVSDPKFKILKLNNCENFDEAINALKHFSSSTHLFVVVLLTSEDWSNINESKFDDLKTCSTDTRPLIVQLNHKKAIDVFYKASQSSSFKKLYNLKRSNLKAFDERGFNSLMLSIEQNNFEALESISAFDFVLNLVAENGKTSAELAWDLKHYECLVKLLEFNSLYPEEFDLEIVDPANKTNLNAIIEKIDTFHAAIKSASIDCIKSFVSDHPNLKFAYNTSNKSAVMIALEAKQFEVYAWLRSFGFIPGYHENFESFQEALKVEEKRKIREANREFFKTSDNSHLFYLLSRTKLGFNVVNKAKCFEVIRKMYMELDEIPEVHPIMLAVENADKLEIVFDFNKPHVMDLNPLTTKHTKGLTYSKRGVISVAAEDHESKFAEIMGTIAHELTHYAMQLIFENDCKPYEPHAVENRDKFAKITYKIYKHFKFYKMSLDPIVRNIFLCYFKHDWLPEVIVSIPHLCARYKNEHEKLKKILNSYCSELFEFYNDKVVKDVVDQRPMIKPRKEIQEINSSGLLPNIRNSGIRLTMTKVKQSESLLIEPTSLPIIVSSDSPLLSLCLIFQSLYNQHGKKVEFLHVFSVMQDLANKEFASKIENAFNSRVKPRLIVDCKNDFKDDAKFWLNFFENFEPHKRIILATSNLECQKLQMIKELPKFQSIELTYSWTDLEEVSQSKLLLTKIWFQGHQVELGQLISLKSSVCDHLPLNDLLTNQLKIKNIEKKLDIFSNNFYISRKFIVQKMITSNKNSDNGFLGRQTQFKWNDDDNEDKVISVHLDLDELIEIAKTDKVMIISDKAGTGKSAVLHKIFTTLKMAHPTFWISLVDLKQHIDSFERVLKSHEKLKSFPILLSQELLKLKTAFERELFLELFHEGKVIILLDGFDEISPLFKELVLSIIASFDSSLSNQLWITTRSHLGKDLETSVNRLSSSILPLRESDQEMFLVEYWKSKNITENSEQIARKLIDKLAKIKIRDRFDLIGSPLLVRMLAEIHGDEISSVELSDTLNFYSIFEIFLSKIIRTWMMVKGELSVSDQVEIHKQKLSVVDVHQKLAICHFFETLRNKCQYDKSEWSNEKIARIGIIYFDEESGIAQFVHEMFAEYFAVSYIVSDLKEMDGVVGLALFISLITSPGHEVIRIFLDKALDDIQLKDDVLKSFGPTFNAFDELNSLGILHKPLKEGRTGLVNFILALLKGNDLLLKKVLLYKTKTGENILMSACLSKNLPLLEKVWFLLSDSLTQEEFADFVMSINDWKANIFHYVINLREEDFLEKFIQRLETVLDLEQRQKIFNQKVGKEKRNALMFATEIENVEILNTILNFIKNLFTPSDLKQILLESDSEGSNFFHIVLKMNSRDHVKAVICFINDPLVCADKKKFLSVSNSQLNNIFHCASFNTIYKGIFEELLALCRDVCTKDDLKSLLKQKNVGGFDVFVLTVILADSQTLKEFIFFIKEFYLKGELRELCIVNAEYYDRNVIAWIFLNKNIGSFEVLWDFLKEIFSLEELTQILNERDKNGSTIMHLAANSINKSIIPSLCKIIESLEWSPNERKMFFQQRNYLARNCFHYTVTSKEEGMVEILWDHVKVILSKNELTDLLLQKTIDGFNSMTLILKSNREEALKDFFAILNEVCTETDKRKVLLSRSVELYCSTLHVAISNKNNILTAFWKFTENVLNESEQKKLIIGSCIRLSPISGDETIFKDNNPLMVAAEFGNKSTVRTLCNIIKSVLDVQEQKVFLRAKNSFGRNIFHIAATFSTNEGIITTLWRYTKEILSKDEIVSMFVEKDGDGQNVLQTLVRYSNVNSLKEFLTIMDETCPIKDKKHLLTEKDEPHKRNPLHLAAVNYENDDVFDALLDYSKAQLNEDELKQLFLERTELCIVGKKDSLISGCTLLMLAVGKLRILKACLMFIIRLNIYNLFEINEERKMFQATNSFGNNCFQCAAYYSETVVVFKTLWNFFIKIEETFPDEIKILLTRKNQNHSNTFQILVTTSGAETLREFIEIVQEVFSLPEQKQFFIDRKEASGQNLLCLVAQNTNENVLEILWNYAKSIFNKEELVKLAIETDFNGCNALHLTLELNNKESTEFLCDFVVNNLTPAIFEQSTVSGTNCLHNAAKNKIFDGNLTVLCSFISKHFSPDKLKDLLLQTCSQEFTVLQAIMMHGNQKSVTEFLSIMGQVLTADELKTLLLKKTEHEQNILRLIASQNENKNISKILWNYVRDILSPDERKNLLFAVDNQHKNAFEIAIICNRKFVVQDFFEIIESLEDKNDQKSLFQRVDSYGNNILHYAMGNPDGIEILSTIWNRLKKILDKNEIVMILNQKKVMSMKEIVEIWPALVDLFTDEEIQNLKQQSAAFNLNISQELSIKKDAKSKILLTDILQIITNDDLLKINEDHEKKLILIFAEPALRNTIQFKSASFISDLFYTFKCLLKRDDIRNLVKDCGFHGCSIFHCAALNSENEGIFPILWHILRSILSEPDIKSLLLKNDFDNSNVFHITILRNNEEALSDLIIIVKDFLSHQEIKQLLLNAGICQRNVLMFAAGFNSDQKVLGELWKLAKKVFTCDELVDYLNITDETESTALHLALEMNNASVGKTMCGIIKDSLNEDCQKMMFQRLGSNGSNIFRCAYLNENAGIFEILWKSLSETLSTDEIKILMRQKIDQNQNILHLMCLKIHGRSFSEFLDGLLKFFSVDNQKILLHDFDEAERQPIKDAFTALFIDEVCTSNRELFADFCNKAQLMLTEVEQKEFIKRCDLNRNNIFHCAASNSTNEGIYATLSVLLRQILKPEEVREMLQEKNTQGIIAFQTVISNSKTESLKNFLLLLQEIFSVETQKELFEEILGTQTFIFLALKITSRSSLEALWEFLQKIFSAAELKSLFFETDEYKTNVFHYAIGYNNKSVVEVFFELLKVLFEKHEQKAILQACNNSGRNVFHCAIGNVQNDSVLSTLIDQMQRIFTDDEIKIIMQQKDLFGLNVLQVQVLVTNETSLTELLFIVERIYSPEDINQLLSDLCSEGRNALMYAAACNEERNVLEGLLTFAKRFLDCQEMKALLQSKDSHNSSALHLTLEVNHKNVVETLIDHIKNELSINDRRILFSSLDADDDCVLHSAAYNEHDGILPTMLTYLGEVFSKNEIRDLVSSRNVYGRNVLSVLVITRDVAAFQDLTLGIRNYFHDDELQDYLLVQSNSHMNLIQTAAAYNKSRFLMKALLNFVMNSYSNSTTAVRQLLSDKDEDGKTAFQLAVLYNNNEVIQEMWDVIDKMFSDHEKNQFLISLEAEV